MIKGDKMNIEEFLTLAAERGIGSIYYCRITSYNENKWSNAPDQ